MALQRIVPQRHGIIRTNMNRNHFGPIVWQKSRRQSAMVEEWKAQVEAMSEGGGAGCPGLWKAAVGGDRSSIGHEALGNVAKIFRRPYVHLGFVGETH